MDNCVICMAMVHKGQEFCPDCENVETSKCNNCDHSITPFISYYNDGICDTCHQEALDNYDREQAAFGRWFAANN